MILLIDNYDSFSYNLYQLIGSILQEDEPDAGAEPDIRVIRNDAMTCEEIEKMQPDRIIISPGPGRPEDAGICVEAVRYFQGKVPILGVCLGHQAICQAFGGEITYAKELMHGKQSAARLDRESILFHDLPEEIAVARYHSLAADAESLPEELRVIAATGDGEIMAVEHREHEIYGLQFHPESVLTPQGEPILRAFLGNRRNTVKEEKGEEKK